MRPVSFTLNGKPVRLTVDETRPLLWVLRDDLGLTGTKFGCGIGQCGACTVHIDGAAQKSCQFPVAAVAGKSVTTIEGLSADGSHPRGALASLRPGPDASATRRTRVVKSLPAGRTSRSTARSDAAPQAAPSTPAPAHLSTCQPCSILRYEGNRKSLAA